MHRTDAMQAPANVLRIILPTVLLVCLVGSGCGYTCYSGFRHGNGSSVAVCNTSCPLNKATGAVILQMSLASAPLAASAAFPPPLTSPRDVQHILVALRGIEAHPDGVADDGSSGWQELAPDLAAHPMQLDLLAPTAPLAMNGDSRSLSLPANANVPATVPADEYRQLGLRLVRLHPFPDDRILESNACGNIGWNCVVFVNSSVRPLEFDGDAAEFHILPQRGADSVFRVLPDSVIHLSIEFNPASMAFFESNASVRLVPFSGPFLKPQRPPPAPNS